MCKRDIRRAERFAKDGLAEGEISELHVGLKSTMNALFLKGLENAEEPPPLLHPNMAEIYHQRIAAL